MLTRMNAYEDECLREQVQCVGLREGGSHPETTVWERKQSAMEDRGSR